MSCSWVEVYGFTARVKRVSLGLPEGAVASEWLRTIATLMWSFNLIEPRRWLCWVPTCRMSFAELRLVEQATIWPSGAGCRTCGAEPGSAVPSSEFPKQVREPTPYCCGCCGAGLATCHDLHQLWNDVVGPERWCRTGRASGSLGRRSA